MTTTRTDRFLPSSNLVRILGLRHQRELGRPYSCSSMLRFLVLLLFLFPTPALVVNAFADDGKAVRDDTDTPAKQVTIALTPYAGRLRTVQVSLDGEPLRMLFDTGGGLTLVTPAVAARLRCTPLGRSVGWRMNGERVEFPLCGATELRSGGHHDRLPNYGTFDLARVLPADLPPLDGIVGLDAFLHRPVLLQFSRQRILIEPAGAAAASGWSEVPMRVASGIDGATTIVYLGVTGTHGRLAWLELDSGNLDTILLSPSGAAVLGLAAAGPPDPLSLKLDPLPLTLGALTTEPLPVSMRDLIHDGALNAQFLERYDLRLDLAARRAWIRPAE